MSFVIVVAAWGCSGGAENREDEPSSEDMIGSPPSDEKRDPFEVMRMPESAKEASKSGVIGGDSSEQEELENQQESLETWSDQTDEMPARRDEPPEESESKSHRCFSCVKLCPDPEEGEGACRPSSEDVICGWGVHPDRTTARRAAKRECGGALEMMRTTERWNTIRGECPEATCQ